MILVDTLWRAVIGSLKTSPGSSMQTEDASSTPRTGPVSIPADFELRRTCSVIALPYPTSRLGAVIAKCTVPLSCASQCGLRKSEGLAS